MITVLGSPKRCCDGVTRRELLRAGGLAMLGGFGLPQLLSAEAARPAGALPGKAKSVIMLYLMGGAPAQDMFDLKPDAAADIRGEFKPASTSVPGIQICEHLPKMAKWMHKTALVRSVNHKAGCHNTLPSYTGYEVPLPNITTTKDSYPPSMGSVCEYLSTKRGTLPSYVYLPNYMGWGQNIRRPGPYGGFLGQRYDPLYTECDPYVDKEGPAERPGYPKVLRGVPRIPNGSLGDELTVDRLNLRHGLVEQIDEQLRGVSGGELEKYGRQRQRAFSLLTSRDARAAFDVEQENPKLREAYGNSLFGQSTLVARRLVEAGVRFVNVTWDCYWDRYKANYDCWDTHTRNFPILREYNLPYFDMAYGVLMDDLSARGLLEETLVVVMTDFGRTPKINGNGGRDHWTFCYSIALSGAGIRGGTVHGESDRQCAFVKTNPVSTGDVCATIYRCLGIDPHLMLPDRSGRPIHIAHGGRPIDEILA